MAFSVGLGGVGWVAEEAIGGRCEGEVVDRAGEDVQHTCV